MQCISVSAKNGLYITDGYNVTHNTSFITQIATTYAINGKNVLVISLEMGKEEMEHKVFCMTQRISEESYRKLEMAKKLECIDEFEKMVIKENLDLTFDDSSLNLEQAIATIKTQMKIKPLDIVFIDYLQLIESDASKKNDSRNNEVSRISRRLKMLATELNIPIVPLSQLNRGVEQRENKRPVLSDLRSSGSIEQDASTVIFLYRDDYYYDNVKEPNVVEVIVAKNRHGATGTEKLDWIPEFTTFMSQKKKYE